MTIKPSHIVMGIVGGAIYTACCIGAGEEIEADMKEYAETHEIETTFDKVRMASYGAYRYGIIVSKALFSTTAWCLMIDGAVSSFKTK